jgi:Ni,Fe-hydrogenase III large subunit
LDSTVTHQSTERKALDVSTQLMVGPYDTRLPGPMLLRLDLHPGTDSSPLGWGVEIASAEVGLGYNYVGLEERVLGLRPIQAVGQPVEWPRALALAEELCGRCSQANVLAFCHAAESLGHLTVPPRAAYLRLVLAETERIASHLLNAAETMRALGLTEREAALRDLRERTIHATVEWSGARVQPGLITFGGLTRNMDETASRILMLATRHIERALRVQVSSIINSREIVARLAGLGPISAEEVVIAGLRGPVARGSGIATDLRSSLAAGAYEDEAVTIISQRAGDTFARLVVRLLESLESLRVIEQALDDLPPGPVKARSSPELREGSAIGRAEGPRGEVFCWVRGGQSGVDGLHLSTPSLPALGIVPGLLRGQRMEDLPLLMLSLDICLGCAER